MFRVNEGEQSREVVIPYGLLHVTPPISAPPMAAPPLAAPEEVASSPLAAAGAFVEVDQDRLQHKRFANVFAIGDVAGLPNSKTAAAVGGKAPVMVANMLA